jgi:hypothetical protein
VYTNNLEVASDKSVKQICHAFQRSPNKSIHQVSRELQVPPVEMHRVLHKWLYPFAYRVQIAQQLTLGDKRYWLKFSIDMLQYINMGPIFLPTILLSDEVTRHITSTYWQIISLRHNEGLHIHLQHSNLHLLLRKHHFIFFAVAVACTGQSCKDT